MTKIQKSLGANVFNFTEYRYWRLAIQYVERRAEEGDLEAGKWMSRTLPQSESTKKHDLEQVVPIIQSLLYTTGEADGH